MNKCVSVLLFIFMACNSLAQPTPSRWDARHEVPRTVPTAPRGNTGNIYREGQHESLVVPEAIAAQVTHWRLLDERMQAYGQGSLQGSPKINFGCMPVGWYRVDFLNAAGAVLDFTTMAVVPRHAAPVPQDSPVCVDAALSWLGEEDAAYWETLSPLAAVAGMNWIRDRIHWREVEPEQGVAAPPGKYDASAETQNRHGMKVLQTFHTTPKWARDPESDPKRPRTDLRHLYTYCKTMATRFQGTVQAWEPWNEGNAWNFGGLTIDEMATLQKTAYLGFKAGDPGLTVCWNPIGGSNTAEQAEGILRNTTWPYYDVYSIHSYDWAHSYEQLWKNARRAACGRPIWVTESDRGMKASPDEPLGDYAPDYAVLKAEFVTQSYTQSLYAGAVRHFHFILGHYMEGEHKVQFGLLREDNTPRPSYSALAALGKFLAGGRCLGRWDTPDQPEVHAYAFRAYPGGEAQDVLVAWTEVERDWPGRGKATVSWPLPELPVDAVYDYLGRPLKGIPDHLTSSPVFVLLPPDGANKLPLRQIEMPPYRDDSASPIVLQFDTPGIKPIIRTAAWTMEPQRVFTPGSTVKAKLFTYNFSANKASGTVKLTDLPKGWQCAPAEFMVALDAMGRHEQDIQLTAPALGPIEDRWMSFQGDFGAAGEPTIAFRVDLPTEEEARKE